MKKFLFPFLFIIAMNAAVANPIGPSQALKIAANYLGEKISSARIAPIRQRSTTADNDTLSPLYIINRGENAGFVIVSGDDCLPGIIGYTDSGDFVEENMPPALLDMLAGYVELVEKAQATGAPTRAPRKAVEGRTTIQPIIQAHWHQTAPYNNLAPFLTGTTNRAMTGCTCTAAVMVLHHYRRDLPNTLQATTPTYGYGGAPVTVSYPKGTPIQWDLMLNSYGQSYPEEMGNAVAVLNAAFGAGIWQTYGVDGGSSTSGQISNIVDGYNSYFNVSSTCKYKGGTSQTVWENLVYNNLAKGQPMVYAGVHPENGGHAIILDGYNAGNNLFHFNFGWGGQGDGYYTLDDETGINGFSSQQGMVYDIIPKKQKLTGKINVDHLLKRVDNEIRVSVTNEGTLDYFGFYLFWSTSDKAPTSSSTISAKNTDMVLATGETGEFTATFKPALERTYYIYLTDKRFNVLDKVGIKVEPSLPDLTVEHMDISASSDIEEHTSETYRILYGDEVTVKATLSNKGTRTQPKFTFELLSYDAAVDSFVISSKKIVDASFKSGETQVLEATFDHLDTEQYYTLRLSEKLSNVDSDVSLTFATLESAIPFKVHPITLDVLSVTDGVMKVKGGWNDKRFAELATDKTITAYDLTEVSGFNSQPVAANPNALFYAKENRFGGYNIVVGQECKELRLQQGYPYAALCDFLAEKAIFTPDWVPGIWHTLALPFEAERPDGYLCRIPTEITTKITSATTTDTLYAHTPYILMSSDETPLPITGCNVYVTRQGKSKGVPEFQAIINESTSGPYTHILDTPSEVTTQYFLPVDSGTVIPALTGVINIDDKGRIRATVNTTLDKFYQTLAATINETRNVYDVYNTIIEEEWNTTLLDSLSSAEQILATMSLTSASEVKKVTNDLLILIETYKLMLYDSSHPICYTNYITNPSFEENTKTGWISDTYAKVRPTSTLTTYGVGAEGNYLLYNEATDGSTTIRQTISGLRRGYYRLTAMVGTNENATVTLFAGDSTTYVPAHEWGRFYLSEGIVDSVWVENGELTIGIEGSDMWYKADAFNLYFLGTGEDNATAITQPENKGTIREGIYDLNGYRLTDHNLMIPGRIYIVNGRKVMRTTY